MAEYVGIDGNRIPEETVIIIKEIEQKCGVKFHSTCYPYSFYSNSHKSQKITEYVFTKEGPNRVQYITMPDWFMLKIIA